MFFCRVLSIDVLSMGGPRRGALCDRVPILLEPGRAVDVDFTVRAEISDVLSREVEVSEFNNRSLQVSLPRSLRRICTPTMCYSTCSRQVLLDIACPSVGRPPESTTWPSNISLRCLRHFPCLVVMLHRTVNPKLLASVDVFSSAAMRMKCTPPSSCLRVFIL